MEKVLSTESLMVLIVLLLPGFVYGRVKHWVVQDREAEKSGVGEEIYANLVRSLVMLSVWPFAIGLSPVAGLVDAVASNRMEVFFSTWGHLWVGAFLVFIGPAVLGGLMGYGEVKELTNWLRRLVRLPAIEWSQAWDVAMGRASQATQAILVAVTIKNGQEIFGRYGKESSASRTGGYRDLYLQELWDVVDGQLAAVPGESILIRGSDIRSVRFMRQQ